MPGRGGKDLYLRAGATPLDMENSNVCSWFLRTPGCAVKDRDRVRDAILLPRLSLAVGKRESLTALCGGSRLKPQLFRVHGDANLWL